MEPDLPAPPGATQPKLAELREPLLPAARETQEKQDAASGPVAGQQRRSRDETVIKMHEEGSSGEQ